MSALRRKCRERASCDGELGQRLAKASDEYFDQVYFPNGPRKARSWLSPVRRAARRLLAQEAIDAEIAALQGI